MTDWPHSYATTADLSAWLGVDAPTGSSSMLRSASVLVARACELDVYDPAPTDEAPATALRDATTAQVKFWIDSGITSPGETLVGTVVKRTKVLTAEVEHDTSGVAQRMQDAAESLCAESADILHGAGLLYIAGPAYADNGGGLARWGADPRPVGSYRGNSSEFIGEILAGRPAPWDFWT